MSCTEELLRGVAVRVEAELKPRLAGFFGGMLQGYLPQAWEFRTEEGVTTLTVGPDGTCRVSRGPAEAPDVTIELAHDLLRRALSERRREGIAPDAVKVTTRTSKGRTAFDFLRSRVGL